MPLTTAHRRFLLLSSGGFCAICKRLLTEEATGSDRGVVVGEEAHIVSAKPNGPRYRPLPPGEVDLPENFILLCPTDHTVIDKQVGFYTEPQVRRIKREHEAWVRQRGSHVPQIRIRDSKPGAPTFVHRIATGAQLMGVVGGCAAMSMTKPDPLSADEVELLAAFLQNMSDYAELWEELEIGARVQAEYDMTQELDEFLEAGFVVYAGERLQVLEGGERGPHTWRLAVVAVHRTGDPEVQPEGPVPPS